MSDPTTRNAAGDRADTQAALRGEVEARGWATLDRDDGSQDLLDFARRFGEPLPSRRGGALIDRLTPRTADVSPPKSLSALFGTNGFPLHTDTAYWPVPARYIILRSNGERHDRPTLLCDSRTLELSEPLRDRLRRATWRVSGSGYTFLSSLVACQHPGPAPCFRFDPGCMTPANLDAAVAHYELTEILAAVQPVRFAWSPGRTLIVDNWRMLHGRAAEPDNPDPDRLVERVTVK